MKYNTLPQLIGFDTLFDTFDRMVESTKHLPKYPPYNVKKTGENSYEIEMAVAGFSKNDIEVTIDGNQLSIKGETKPDESNYVYKGIADRSFNTKFTLADNMKVNSGEFVNGMLKIALEAQVATSKLLKLDIK